MFVKKLRSDKNHNNIEIEILHDFDFDIQDDLNNIYLQKNVDSIIGKPRNFEKTDYYFSENNLKFNLFFFKDLTEDNVKNIHAFSGTDWNTYYDLLKNKLKNFITSENDIYLPSFYNSFAYLYEDQENKYKNKFNTQPFFYYSFLRIDFYTSPDIVSRKKIFTKIIYNTPRYLGTELGFNNISQPAPIYLFDESTDGFVINWLINTPITEMYAAYSYFNAFKKTTTTISGETIYLIPSAVNSNFKLKWIMPSIPSYSYYAKYILNPGPNTYDIFLYNDKTNQFTIRTNEIDLYASVIDPYWSKVDGFVDINDKLSLTARDFGSKFSMSNRVSLFMEYSPSFNEYVDNSLLDGQETPFIIENGIKQTIVNEGSNELRLVGISSNNIDLDDQNLLKFAIKPSISYDIISFDSALKNDRKYSLSNYMFFETRDRENIMRRSSGEPVLWHDNLYVQYTREVSLGTVTNPIIVHDLPLAINIIYGIDRNKTIKPSERVDLFFTTTISGRFARACVPNMFINSIFSSLIEVNVLMEDVVTNERVSNKFLVDFRLLTKRDVSKDGMQSLQPLEQKTRGGRATQPRGGRATENPNYWYNGSGYTQNNLNNELLTFINIPITVDNLIEIKPINDKQSWRGRI